MSGKINTNSAMTIDILLPIYNEEKILAANLRLLFAYCQQNLTDDWQIILIINGSTDQSLSIARNLSQQLDRLKIITLPLSGKGRALKNGLKDSVAEVIVYMDIDLAVALSALPQLISLVAEKKYALAFGSRLSPNSQTERSLLRNCSSKIYNRLASALLDCPISDWQCGFKALNHSAKQIILPLIQDDQWFFDTELIAWAHKKNLPITEIPVCWSENRYATRRSKIRPLRDGFIFFKNLLQLKKRLKK